MKRLGVLLAVLVAASGTTVAAQTADLSAEHRRLDFLAGRWSTMSETGQGISIPGTLEYEWVLGGQWLKVVFVGQPEDGRVWEAYAMVKYEPTSSEYVSYAFFNANDPIRYRGYPLDGTTLRFEHETADGTFGIDYTDRGDGTVYQENWAMSPGGERTVTLRTTYTPAE